MPSIAPVADPIAVTLPPTRASARRPFDYIVSFEFDPTALAVAFGRHRAGMGRPTLSR
jgi:hypothetical protein